MAIVLNQYRHGSSYKDQVGRLYHFPKRYLQSFEHLPIRFVYYEPREGGLQQYFGTGVVSSVYEDTEDDGHFYADLCEYIDFSQAVGYYDAPNGSWEPSKTMRSSVRRIDDQLYEQLCSNGGVLTAPSLNALTTDLERITSELHALLPNGKVPKDPGILRKVKRILQLYERPSAVTNHVKAIRGDRCQLCGVRGFLMRNGRRYCEIHHLFQLANDPPVDCLKAEYVVVLCATCHRRMHYAQVGIPQRHDSGWTLDVDGDRVYFDTYFQAVN